MWDREKYMREYYHAHRKLKPKESHRPRTDFRMLNAGITRESLFDMYVTQRMSMERIGRKFGVTQKAVDYWMRKWNIPARTKKDAVTLSRLREAFSGPNNPNWNGGRVMSPSGYMTVRDPKHPRAQLRGYVLEHIKVWMETHGKEVPQGWQVHHINGDKLDNRPENLVALSEKKHRKVIPLLQRRIRQLEKLLFAKKAATTASTQKK